MSSAAFMRANASRRQVRLKTPMVSLVAAHRGIKEARLEFELKEPGSS